jgi:16S rRNA (uracil1498-N3)-methyltransferase
MADRFYTSDQLGPGEYTLTGSEAHHLSAVRRFGQGDCVSLFNGDGNEYPAEVVATSKKTVTLNVLRIEPADRELPFQLVVASALPKGDRADFLIEKLTELGATRFVPLVTARAVVQPRASVVEKFTRAVIEASKQCGRNRLMNIDPPRTWAAFLALPDLPPARLLLHTDTGSPLAAGNAAGVVVAVGPEGGFSAEEVAAATEAAWRVVSLGKRVLRVETAAMAAAACLSVSSKQ